MLECNSLIEINIVTMKQYRNNTCMHNDKQYTYFLGFIVLSYFSCWGWIRNTQQYNHSMQHNIQYIQMQILSNFEVAVGKLNW